MQDRFRFRIWDKPTSKMFYDVCIGFIKDGYLSSYDWVCADIPDGQINYTGNMLQDIEIMQCTGLKDNNGKLIFEGDIVARGEDKAVIKYDDETASFYMRWVETETFIEDCEVIGNIYENPELLEVDIANI